MKACAFAIAVLAVMGMSLAHPQTAEGATDAGADAKALFDEAGKHFRKGEYPQAIAIYDDILEIRPENIPTLKMKGVAQSNLGYHEKSLEQFFRILQHDGDDLHALAGMGVGMGYLGEYEEAAGYFQKALRVKPDSAVLQNYAEYVDRVIKKYPYTPTDKPEQLLPPPAITEIPPWVKDVAGWWAGGKTSDSEFAAAMEYLVANGVVVIPAAEPGREETPSGRVTAVPAWVKTNAGLWADGTADEAGFVKGLQFLVSGGAIQTLPQKAEPETQKEMDDEFFHFKQYVRSISRNVADEKRYIDFPNPSQDVIKKFMRDYVKWNFAGEAKRASTGFPDPSYEVAGGEIVLKYVIFVNEQPSGLPLDHTGTLRESLAYWEAQELVSDGQKVRVEFEFTNLKHEANVWVTWVVRDLGDGVLGHAHLGKGIVEVVLGDYSCDGSFQLYDVDSVEGIMRHELGHSIGLSHVDSPGSVMHPTYDPGYAYCLLG